MVLPLLFSSDGMPHRPNVPAPSVLFIEESKDQRTYWINQLKSCSTDYEILEAADGQSGLDLCLFRRIDCVILELDLPDQSGFQVSVQLVPLASRPCVAVLVLT
jgi:two-component system KDP operon response regulator KdpE